MKKLLFKSAIALSLPFLLIACSEDDDDVQEPDTVKEWTLNLSTKNENPAVPSRTETGTVTLQLLADNSLKYNISVNGLAGGDALQAAHLHAGDAITNGPVILSLDPTFTGGNATGTITGLRQSLVDSLKSDANHIYFNAHSQQVASGLVRAQLNSKVEFAMDVALSGTNEVPAVVTTATGTAILRMTADKKLYSNVTVSNLESIDALSMAHIHKGAEGANGDVLVGLAASAADFGVVKTISLDDAAFAAIKGTDALYVNAHSTLHAGGVVRGQIR
ncbi:CHRD domain-containing protein [Flavihumibacter sp. ZG627]|uniref:CHRD domain-containing protein n=1 Tax=Flavihumibacter sp. ZG627 TaxID=1463156 RepID=UPI00057CC916|nr:CHRD domain-containing protein [Flavihumibacter sp. ZG627]KIC89233.1 hypothetical protein HY58_17585 [Flavihumibacter sp. ZG627]